jgi:A/G-specific adenine glycosylase
MPLAHAARLSPMQPETVWTLAAAAMPSMPTDAVVWNVAVMELGALVCTARSPACHRCPVRGQCRWERAGRPAYQGPVRRAQAWVGTDRQCRGALLAQLRAAPGPIRAARLAAAWPDETQRARCLDSLVADGLVEPLPGNRFRLPG